MYQTEKGSVAVFPPMWMFPHEGDAQKSPKFIMIYLHFKLTNQDKSDKI